MDFNSVWESVKNYFSDNYMSYVKFFSALIIGIIIIKILMRIITKIFAKSRMEHIAQKFLLTIIKFVLWLIFILSLLSLIGVEVSGMLTAISAILLAIGMALESNIANLANGIVIVSSHMFKKGDLISVNGVDGRVTEINFLFTTLTTPDNKKVTLPNSAIVNNAVVNAGANPKRRVDFTFSVAYETDVESVKKTVVEVMESNGSVYLDPKPFCKLKTLNSSSLDFFANCWCDSNDYWDVYYYVVENVYNEFKKKGISVPFTQIEVRERTDTVNMPFNPAPLPERVEKERPEEPETFIDKVKKAVDVENINRKKNKNNKQK